MPEPQTSIPDGAQALVVSYLSIRRAIGGIGLLLPILLGPVGWLVFGIAIQDNMSSYYHTPLRDVFVGAMCAIGIFLFCYRGYDWIEAATANFGAISALGIAFCPLDAGTDPLQQSSLMGYAHIISGAVFFLTLAFYSLYHFPSRKDTEQELAPHLAERNFVYRTSGIVILLSMLAMGVYLFGIGDRLTQTLNRYNFLFWMEWIAIWAFAAAWLTKGRAIFAEMAIDILSVPGKILRK